MSIFREKCAICYNNLMNIYSLEKMPTNLSCTDKLTLYNYDKLSYSKCSNCNTIQLDILIPLHILYQFSHNFTSVGKIWENYFNLFIETLNTIVPFKTILEVGCPSGKLAINCNDYNKWYIVEPNKNQNALFNNKIVFIETFFDENFELKEKVDIIVHSHLFEHIYSPNEFLKKCNDTLKDDGEMIFGVPNMQHMIDNTLFLGLCFEHTIFLNKENITYLLNKNGFQIIKIVDYEAHSTIYHTKKILEINIPLFKIKDYFEQFYKVIDDYKVFVENCNKIINNNLNKDIFIFCASYNTQTLLFFGLNNNITGILDNCKEKQNKYLYGTNLKIYSPDILINNDAIVILKNGYYVNEIISQIKTLNNNVIIID